ncbi:MAG: DUF1016 domain-containing protein [Deltaproteobacteria bacterium]|nr:DUF1016 domain-containing protein [Deltaproteobacteria bacterium]
MKRKKNLETKSLLPTTEHALYKRIRELILIARSTVARGVDLVQVHTNFEIGRHVIAHEQQGKERAEYGQEVLKRLAEKLTREFGRGFSKSNLEYIRRFFLTYRDRSQIAQIPIGQSSIARSQKAKIAQFEIGQLASGTKPQQAFCLSWTHYIFLMVIKNPDERRFYEIEAQAQNWNIKELRRQFNSSLYERLALSRDKKRIRKLSEEGHVVAAPHDLLKEPLVLEFLGLDEKHGYSESDLESAIIDQIEHFLLELGKGFLFEARQKRFTFGDDHFFVDLVFYNRILRCYVVIDLKIGKLAHQDLGQMQMYVNYFDRFVKTKEENSTVGIVLCKEKKEALVEITLPKDANIHAKEYQLYLPSKRELQRKLLEWADKEQGNGG